MVYRVMCLPRDISAEEDSMVAARWQYRLKMECAVCMRHIVMVLEAFPFQESSSIATNWMELG